jgi:mono/diheme cytochrome c family protein
MKLFALIYLLTIGGLTMVLFQEKTKEESIKAGHEIYQDFCVQCHLNSGEGVSGVFPPLKASDYLMNNVEKSVAGIKYGLRGKITVNDEIYDGIMVSQGLDNEEIADVMNYILNEWGNSYTEQITSEEVNKIPKNLVD